MKIQFKSYFYLLLFIFGWCTNNAYAQQSILKLESFNLIKQNPNDKSLENLSQNVRSNEENKGFGFGINLEGLSGSLFCQKKFSDINHDLGLRIGAGYNSTSFIILAGSRFSSKYSLRYEKRDADDGDFFYEFIWIDIYLEKVKKKFNFQYGIRISKFGHNNDRTTGRIGGDFLGFYFQPTIGKGLIRIGSRIQWGVLRDKTMSKNFNNELAVIGSPIVLILNFGNRK